MCLAGQPQDFIASTSSPNTTGSDDHEVTETSIEPRFIQENVPISLVVEQSQQIVGLLKDSVAVFTKLIRHHCVIKVVYTETKRSAELFDPALLV